MPFRLQFDLRFSYRDTDAQGIIVSLWNGICIDMFFAALFVIAKTWTELKHPLIEDQLDYGMSWQGNTTYSI